MRIRKISQLSGFVGTISNSYSTSNTDTYSCDYINGLNTYSTSETRIGTWIDGKPLYRVFFSTTTPSSSNVASIGTIASLNYNKIISLNGMLYTANQSVPLNWLYSTNEINSLYVEGNNVMCKITASSYQNKTCYIILEYTKTTD